MYPYIINYEVVKIVINNEPIVEQSQEIVLRRSQRERRSAISNDYVGRATFQVMIR